MTNPNAVILYCIYCMVVVMIKPVGYSLVKY